MSKRKREEEDGGADWNCDEQLQLLDALKSQCPQNDKLSYSARSKNVKWEKVTVKDRTPEQCQEAWIAILKRIRKFRTLEEVVSDAKDYVQHPEKYAKGKRKVKHPDQPTKPLSPYFQYMSDHREKVKSKHPHLTNTELLKKIAEKWGALHPDKRSKYDNRYQKKLKEYHEASEKFLSLHPELIKLPRPIRPSSFNTFVKSRKQSLKEKHPELSDKEVYTKLRKKFEKLNPEKRKKWVQKALDAIPDYEEELRNYQVQHPDFKPPKKKVCLSVEEQKLVGLDVKIRGKKDSKFPDAPKLPPRSAFNLFVSKSVHKMEGTLQSKMQILGHQWKELGPKQAKYSEKLKKLNKRYKKEVEEYTQNFTAEDVALFQKSLNRKAQLLLGIASSVNGDLTSGPQEETISFDEYASKSDAESREQTSYANDIADMDFSNESE